MGRDVAARMAALGWRIGAESRTTFKLSLLGSGFAGLFEPVVSFYLNEARRLGFCQEEQAERWLQALQQGLRGGFSEARIPLFHVVALP